MDYRIQRGLELRNALVTIEEFQHNFSQILNNNCSIREYDIEKIDYESISALYLEVENEYQNPFRGFETFGVKAIFIFQ